MSTVRRYVSRSEAGLCPDTDAITRHMHLEETRKKMLQLLAEKLHEIEKERASTRAMTESMIDLAKQCRIQEGQLRPKLKDQDKAIRMINKMLREIQTERQISNEKIKSTTQQAQGNVRDEKLRVKFQQQIQSHPTEAAVPPGYYVPTDEEFHVGLLADKQKANEDAIYNLPETSTPEYPKTRPRRSTSVLEYPKNVARYSSPVMMEPPLLSYRTRREIPELHEAVDDYSYGEDSFQDSLQPVRCSYPEPPGQELAVLRKVQRKVPLGVYQQRRVLEPTEYRTGTEGLLGYDRASGRL